MTSGRSHKHVLHNCETCLKVIPINGRPASTYNPAKTCSILCRKILMQKQASARSARQGGGKKDVPYIQTAMDKFLRKKR